MNANTERAMIPFRALRTYAPRHAAPAYAPRHAAPPLIQRIKDRACAAWKRLGPVLAWINCQMEKDMSGPALALSGALMGLIIWPVLLYCFFA